MMQYRHSSEEINALLQQRVIELCGALGLNGRLQSGNYWVRDFRRKDGGNLTSFSVETRRGFWKDFASDEGGDLIHLIAVFACGGDDAKAIRWAQDWLGLRGDGLAPNRREVAALAARKREAEEEERTREEGRRKTARKIWLDGVPLDGRDPASLYLLWRGIDVTKLAGGIPGALRFAPDCLAMPEDQRLAAMVANISGRGGMIAVHRTYLENAGGVWRKAWKGQERDGRPVAAKRVLGRYAGGTIRLTRGASGKPLAQAPKGEWIAVAEGIENALTVALAVPELRCLAAVSASNIGNIELPPQIGGVYVIADNDKEPAAISALDRAMDKLASRKIEPALVRGSDGFKDFNDWLNGAARV